jgi:hypothetical protein
MFTGIIEEVGRIAQIEQRGEDRRITIAAELAPKELKPGDSMAVLPPSILSPVRLALIWRRKPGCAHPFHACTKARGSTLSFR